MKRTLYTAFFVAAALLGAWGMHYAHAQYMTPGFTLHNNSTCEGGTLILQYGDVQDTGAPVSAKALATLDCQYYMTGPDQCCSVQYRRATPKAPAIGSHVFMYEVRQGGIVAPSTPPSGTQTMSFQYWAGVSGPAAPAVTASLVANPTSVVAGGKSLLTWSSTGATSCTGTNFSTGGATSGSLEVKPLNSTLYTVDCTNGTASASANASVSVVPPSEEEPAFSVSCRVAPSTTAIGSPVTWSSTVTGAAGTYSYSWSGTDGLMGTNTQVSKTYTTTGHKTASLTVTYTPPGDTAATGGTAPTPPTPPPAAPTAPTTPPTQGGGAAGATCPQTGWVAPTTPCAGMWVPAYTNSCQTGWQCTVAATTGGGGGTVAPTQPEPSFWETILNNFESPTRNSIPEQGDVNGSVMGATAQTITAACSGLICTNATCSCTGPNCGGVEVGEEEEEPPIPQCSDGIDNDGDGLSDQNDPGCTHGGGGGGGGAGGYNPDGDDESATPGTPQQCTAGNFCKNSDVYFRNAQCVESFVKTCPFGCLNGECMDGPAPSAEPDLSLKASPPLIKKGQSCTLTVSARNVTSCSVTGTGVSITLPAIGGIVNTTTVVSPSLLQTTPYKLSCTGVNGVMVSKSIDCKIAPTFEEF